MGYPVLPDYRYNRIKKVYCELLEQLAITRYFRESLNLKYAHQHTHGIVFLFTSLTLLELEQTQFTYN